MYFFKNVVYFLKILELKRQIQLYARRSPSWAPDARGSPENHTRFQTKTALKPYPLGWHILYSLSMGVPPPHPSGRTVTVKVRKILAMFFCHSLTGNQSLWH